MSNVFYFSPDEIIEIAGGYSGATPDTVPVPREAIEQTIRNGEYLKSRLSGNAHQRRKVGRHIERELAPWRACL